MIISVILNIAYLNCLNQQSYILKQVPEVIHSFSDITVANLAARTAKAFQQSLFYRVLQRAKPAGLYL
jgi:hypothetical protein